MRKSVLLIFLVLYVCAATDALAQRTGARTTRRRPAATQRAKPTPKPATTVTTAPVKKADDCGCEMETLPGVVAVVNGVKITSEEIDLPISDKIQQLQQSVAGVRRSTLDLKIKYILLEAEAKRRGKTTEQLLREEVAAKVSEPTEAEARAYYDQNKAQIGTAWSADLKDQIITYMREQRQQEEKNKFADSLRVRAQVKQNVAEATPPSTPADRARVFATVNGADITSAMIEDAMKPVMYDVQRQVYTLRKQQLDQRINDILLEAEAQKRGMTARAILDAEVTAKTPVVTELQARKFYDENKERINSDFDTVKYQIIQYLTEQQQQKLESELVERLRSGATIQTFLREPAAPVYEISTDDRPSRGALNAPVTIVEFTDFQCPSCAAMQPVLERITAEYGDERVRLVVRDFPLQMHANARKAAEAAEAARAQGKYWEYTALLFANQSALGVPQLKEYATRVGLDRAKFDAALDSGQLARKVQFDLNDGNRLGIHGTPTIFVNGRPLGDNTYEALKAMIDAALKEKGKS